MTFELSDIIVLLIIFVVIYQFWRIRDITERITRYVMQYCDGHNLQFISLSRRYSRLTWKRGKLDWRSEFEFEFSSNGEDSYTGVVLALGHRVLSTQLPVHRI